MERPKVYLDTNMILDVFLGQVRARREQRSAIPPKKFQFLASQKGNFQYITSVVTRAEVMRELVSAHHFLASEVNLIWENVLSELECGYVPKCILDEQLVEIVGALQLRLRTLLNLVHLFIAADEGAWFVTGDKDILEKVPQIKIPIRALSYPDLRQIASGDPGASPPDQG